MAVAPFRKTMWHRPMDVDEQRVPFRFAIYAEHADRPLWRSCALAIDVPLYRYPYNGPSIGLSWFGRVGWYWVRVRDQEPIQPEFPGTAAQCWTGTRR